MIDNNILFTLFNGEAFDYIGSQRVAYDLNRGVWPDHAPLTLDDIQLHVEVGQIGGSLQDQQSETPNTKWPMYAFTPNDQFNKEVSIFLKKTNISKVKLQDRTPLSLKNKVPSPIQ